MERGRASTKQLNAGASVCALNYIFRQVCRRSPLWRMQAAFAPRTPAFIIDQRVNMLAPGLLPGLSRGPHEAEVNTTPPQLDSGPASREFRNNYRPLSLSRRRISKYLRILQFFFRISVPGVSAAPIAVPLPILSSPSSEVPSERSPANSILDTPELPSSPNYCCGPKINVPRPLRDARSGAPSVKAERSFQIFLYALLVAR